MTDGSSVPKARLKSLVPEATVSRDSVSVSRGILARAPGNLYRLLRATPKFIFSIGNYLGPYNIGA